MKAPSILLLVLSIGFLNGHSCLAGPPDNIRSNLVELFDPIQLVAFSPDGSLLATGAIGNEPEFMVLRAADLSHVWNELNTLYEGWEPHSIAFAADNSMVAFGSTHRAAELFGVDSGTWITTLSSYDGPRRVGDVVALSPIANSDVVISAGVDGIQKLGGSPFPGSAQSGTVTSLAFEANGASFWIGNYAGIVQHWQMQPPQLLWQTNFPNNSVSGINVLPDGRQIITLSSNLDYYNDYYYWSDVRLFEIGHTNFLLHLTPDFPMFSTTLTPDGKYLFTTLKTWDDNDYQTNHVVVWRIADGKEMVRYDEELYGVQQVAIAPDQKTFAYGREDGMVFIARMPLLIDSVTRTGNQTLLRWQGGSGLYQLQSRTNFTTDTWHNLGTSTTNTLATNTSSTTLFFRVQSLPNP